MLEIPAELGRREQWWWWSKGGVEVRAEGNPDLQEGLMIYLDPGGTCASQTLMAAVTLPTRMVLGFRKEKTNSKPVGKFMCGHCSEIFHLAG